MLPILLSQIEDPEDQKLITHIYEEYYGLMYHMARRYVKDPNDIEDIIHDSILRLIHNLSTIRKIDCNRLAPYIVKVCKSVALDKIKKEKRLIPFAELFDGFEETQEPESCAESVEEELEAKDLRRKWIRLLRRLPARQQFLIFAKYYLELSDKEIALHIAVSEKSVRTLIHRARKMLKEILNQEEREDQYEP